MRRQEEEEDKGEHEEDEQGCGKEGGWRRLGVGWGKEGEEEQEEDCKSVQTVSLCPLHQTSTGNLPIQTMNLVMTCRRRAAGVNKQFCSEGIHILREIYDKYYS